MTDKKVAREQTMSCLVVPEANTGAMRLFASRRETTQGSIAVDAPPCAVGAKKYVVYNANTYGGGSDFIRLYDTEAEARMYKQQYTLEYKRRTKRDAPEIHITVVRCE